MAEIEAESRRAEEATLAFEAYEWSRRHAPVRPGCSPLETTLIQAIGMFAQPIPRGGSAAAPVMMGDGTLLYRLGPWWGFWQLSVGRYFADIAFVVDAVTPGVVIECDGHDFHERTKEQAAHDRGRDRWMQANGWSVLRFTGSEIHRDPHRCAEEAISFLRSRRAF